MKEAKAKGLDVPGFYFDSLNYALRCSIRSIVPRTIWASPKPVMPHETLDESGFSDNPVAVTTVPRIAGIIPSRIFIKMTSMSY